MLPDSILPTPEDDIARILAGYEKRLSHLEILEGPGGFEIGARVFNSANISIPSGVNTILTFDSERFDTDNIHSLILNTGRLTAQTAGKYDIKGHINWQSAPGGIRQMGVLLNGATTIVLETEDPPATQLNRLIVATTYELVVGDFVELQVHQSSGGAINVTANPNWSPEFMMQKTG